MIKTCIITIIKNEHLYLDEWINYHLNLGIEHLFIYEDIDSITHKEIVEKYDDKVSLNSVFSILSDKDKEKAIWLKKTHKWNPQHMYLRSALKHLKEDFHNEYNWSFVLDGDEFITIESDKKTLGDILPLYNEYDAVVVKWLCYGANGLVDKPDYSINGLIKTYTTPITDYTHDPATHIKTCYNMAKYDKTLIYNQHHSIKECNWCNTNFKKDIVNASYTNIYIRHYITKSWEEYVWKVRERGFLWDGNRNLDYFFLVNSDMLPLKDELMTSLYNTEKEKN